MNARKEHTGVNIYAKIQKVVTNATVNQDLHYTVMGNLAQVTNIKSTGSTGRFTEITIYCLL